MSAPYTIAKVLQNCHQIPRWTRISQRFFVKTQGCVQHLTDRKIRSTNFPLMTGCLQGNKRMKSHDSLNHDVTWHDVRAQGNSNITSKFAVLQLDEVVDLVREEGGVDVVVIAVPEEMCYVEYFIVATAISPRHLTSVVEMINKLYKRKRNDNQPFTLIEGKRHSDDWQCIDLGNIVVHVMLEKTRSLYNLEELWLHGPKYDEELCKAPTTEDIISQISKHGLNLMSMTDDTVKALGNIDLDNPWVKDLHVGQPTPSQISDNDRNTEMEDDDAFLV